MLEEYSLRISRAQHLILKYGVSPSQVIVEEGDSIDRADFDEMTEETGKNRTSQRMTIRQTLPQIDFKDEPIESDRPSHKPHSTGIKIP